MHVNIDLFETMGNHGQAVKYFECFETPLENYSTGKILASNDLK